MQESFGDVEVFWSQTPHRDHVANGDSNVNGVQRTNVIEALLRITLERTPIHLLDSRFAARQCLEAFFENHSGIRGHVLRRAIDGHLSGQDPVPNILSVIGIPPETRGNADPYQTWVASVLMFHLLFENSEGKAMAMKVTEGDAENGEEVITCIQSITGNLVTGMQRGDDERISIGYLMLLCGWLFEDPDSVNDFLGEGSSIQSLLQEVKLRGASNVLVPGLCTVLLGIVYEFSSKDSPIPRATLHKLLTEQLGREQYIDKINRLRGSPWVRDFEVLPQTLAGQHDAGLPDVFFDGTFIDFLKDNFSRLVRAIDREPGFEISVVTNGVQKGISRELVDSLRSQLEDRTQSIQNLESNMLTVQRKFDQESLNHRKTKESNNLELSRIKQINEALQRNHEEEQARLDEYYKNDRNELIRQHGEQLRAIDQQLRSVSADYERNGIEIREHHNVEINDLKRTIQTLESDHERARQQHAAEVAELNKTIHDLQLSVEEVRRQRDAEAASLRETIHTLESNLDEVKQKSAQDLQAARDENATKVSALERQVSEAEKQTTEAQTGKTEAERQTKEAQGSMTETAAELKEAQASLEKAETEAKEKTESGNRIQAELEKANQGVKEKEEARRTAQSELEDLLIVFGDLEAKRKQDKVRCRRQKS